jgi:nucleotide-binding universal stress UspA family protein
MKPTQIKPTLVGMEHDSEHRLIGLVYDSTPPLSASTTNSWLVAVDGSDNALRAVTHTVHQAREMIGCAVHLIHVQPWLSKEAAEMQLEHLSLGVTSRARALLDRAGLPWRLHVMMGDPAERIFDQVTRLNATTIVIGSRGLNALESLVFGSIAYKVVHRSIIPVIVVP